MNVSLAVDLSIRNPNQVGFKYQNSSVLLDYRGNDVGEAPIPAGQIPAGETLSLNLTLTVMADRFISNSPLSIPSLEATKGETFTDVVGSPYYVAPEVVKYYANVMVKRRMFGVQELQFSKACFIPLDYESISQISFDSHHIKPASVLATD